MMKSLNILLQIFTVQRNASVIHSNQDDLLSVLSKLICSGEQDCTTTGKEKAMCVIQIRVQCSERFSELLVGDVQNAELTVESIVGTALLEVFDIVQVEDVTLLPPRSATKGMVADRE